MIIIVIQVKHHFEYLILTKIKLCNFTTPITVVGAIAVKGKTVILDHMASIRPFKPIKEGHSYDCLGSEFDIFLTALSSCLEVVYVM